MKREFVSILAIILGVIIILLPMFGVITAGAIIGLSTLLISIYLLVLGVSIMDQNKWGSILYLIVGIIILIFSICIIFSPQLLASLTAYILYIAGIFLIIIGVISIVNNRYNKYGFIIGIVTVLIGVIYILVGNLVHDPIILGYLIGLYLLISGCLSLLDR